MAKSKREFIAVENATIFTDCIESIIDDAGIVSVVTVSGNKYTTTRMDKEDIMRAILQLPARKG